MKRIVVILFLFLSLDSYSQGTHFFAGTWAEALRQADKEGKLIFVDVSTPWCKPCKKMKKDILPQKKTGDFFNANFINLSIDAYDLKGLELALFYKINSFPTFLFIDKKGNIIYKAFGFKTADQLIKIGEHTLNYYYNYRDYERQYRDGKRNYAFIVKYINALKKLDKPTEYLANEFLSSNKLREELRLKFIYRTINTTLGKLFEELIKNINKIKTFYKPEDVNNKIRNLFNVDIEKYVYSGKRKKLKNVLKIIKPIDFLNYNEFKVYSKLILAKKKAKYKKYIKYAQQYFDLLKDDKQKREFIKELYLTKVGDKDMKNIAYNLANKLNKEDLKNRVLLVKIAVLSNHLGEAEKQIKIVYKSKEISQNKPIRYQLKHYNNYLIKNKSVIKK